MRHEKMIERLTDAETRLQEDGHRITAAGVRDVIRHLRRTETENRRMAFGEETPVDEAGS